MTQLVIFVPQHADDELSEEPDGWEQQLNHPPNKPDKPSGETNRKINTEYIYSTSTIDVDGDQVWYQWDWGDGLQSNWLGPYNSGDTINTTHTWTVKSFSIKVKAKDTFDAESDWSELLVVTMLVSISIPFMQIWMKLFQRFPNAFPLL